MCESRRQAHRVMLRRSEPFDMRLRFGSATDAARYIRALTSLLFGMSIKVTATLRTGVSREDLTAEEIADRLARNSRG